MNQDYNLNKQQKHLIFDYSSGLTTTVKEIIEAERLIGTNEQAAKLHTSLKFIIAVIETGLESEPCPDELVERTILRLKLLAKKRR